MNKVFPLLLLKINKLLLLLLLLQFNTFLYPVDTVLTHPCSLQGLETEQGIKDQNRRIGRKIYNNGMNLLYNAQFPVRTYCNLDHYHVSLKHLVSFK